MLTFTGTSGNTWRSFADQLAATKGQNVSVLDSPSDSLTKLSQSDGTARITIFAECPASLITNGFKEPGTLLDEWKTSAAALLALWRKNRKTATILNWDECVADPAAAEVWFAKRLGIESTSARQTLTYEPEPSLAKRVIAAAIVARDREATRLWKELQATSQLISDKAAVSDSLSPELALAEITRGQDQLTRKSDELANRNSSLSTALEELRDQHSSLIAERDSMAQELEHTKRLSAENSEMLLQELQNAHKESEDFFEQWKSLEASNGEHHLSVERVLRGSEKLHPPHNHLDYVFEGASLFDRHWRRLPVRLVEHNGNAGLALFNPFGNGTAPLYHWEPSGQETGSDFMLFVPSDKRAAAKLVGLPASDLLLVRDAAAKILGHLSVHGGPEAERWLPVARRLLQEIEEIPERLHYDSVAGFNHRENNQTFIRFNAANLYYRGKCAGSFVFDWAPASSGGTLRFEKCKGNTSLFLAGASEVALGFASAEDRETVNKLWPKLTAHDRTFLLLLAKALPDFVFHLCQQHPDQNANKERLTKQARKLYSRLRNLDRKHKFKAALAQSVR